MNFELSLSELVQLVEELTEQTELGKTVWERTDSEDGFTTFHSAKKVTANLVWTGRPRRIRLLVSRRGEREEQAIEQTEGASSHADERRLNAALAYLHQVVERLTAPPMSPLEDLVRGLDE